MWYAIAVTAVSGDFFSAKLLTPVSDPAKSAMITQRLQRIPCDSHLIAPARTHAGHGNLQKKDRSGKSWLRSQHGSPPPPPCQYSEAARREMQMYARANYYVTGIMPVSPAACLPPAAVLNAFSSFGPAGNFSPPNRKRYGLSAANAARYGLSAANAARTGAANYTNAMHAFDTALPTAAPATSPTAALGQTATPPPAAGASLWGSVPDPFGAPPTPAPGGMFAAVVDFRAELIKIWTAHAPEKLKNVDKVLLKYKGKESLMIAKLQKKYACCSQQMNPRTPQTERDSSVLYGHFARDGRLYPIHPDSSESGAVEDVDGAMEEVSVVVDSNGRTRLCQNKVDLANQGLPEFPSELYDPLRAGTVRMLDLSGNNLTALPESIGALVGVEKLNLSGNNLTALPESIVALTSLKTLHLHENPLTKPQSPAVEAWLAALQRGGCIVSR